jgi:hypothetical protein
MRRAALGLITWLCAAPAFAEITAAEYSAPTERYAHAVLGDSIEYGALKITFKENGVSKVSTITLPQDHVFEDIAPRLADVDGDGQPEVVVIETDVNAGGALAIYDQSGKIAETPHIGSSHRWLAPIGVADFNADGNIDLAYIDRPHLAKTLRVWTFKDNGLTEIANIAGVTNHRIGDDFITSGVRTCEGLPEMITVSSNWQRIVSTSFSNGKLSITDLGAFKGPQSLKRALNC